MIAFPSRAASLSTHTEAFTLVELLVALGMIAILVTLLLAGILGAKRSAHQIRCVNHVRQIGTALQGVIADQHVYPLAINFGFSQNRRNEDHGPSWMNALEAQLSGRTFFVGDRYH